MTNWTTDKNSDARQTSFCNLVVTQLVEYRENDSKDWRKAPQAWAFCAPVEKEATAHEGGKRFLYNDTHREQPMRLQRAGEYRLVYQLKPLREDVHAECRFDPTVYDSNHINAELYVSVGAGSCSAFKASVVAHPGVPAGYAAFGKRLTLHIRFYDGEGEHANLCQAPAKTVSTALNLQKEALETDPTKMLVFSTDGRLQLDKNTPLKIEKEAGAQKGFLSGLNVSIGAANPKAGIHTEPGLNPMRNEGIGSRSQPTPVPLKLNFLLDVNAGPDGAVRFTTHDMTLPCISQGALRLEPPKPAAEGMDVTGDDDEEEPSSVVGQEQFGCGDGDGRDADAAQPLEPRRPPTPSHRRLGAPEEEGSRC